MTSKQTFLVAGVAGLLALLLAWLILPLRSSEVADGAQPNLQPTPPSALELAKAQATSSPEALTPPLKSGPPPAPSGQLRIVTVDPEGQPLGQVDVYAEEEQIPSVPKCNLIGTSGDDGILDVERPAAGRRLLAGKKKGFATGTTSMARVDESVEAVTLQLAVGRAIHGRVIWQSGKAAGEGVSIYARAWGDLPFITGLRDPAHPDPRIIMTMSHPDGSFSVDDCTEGQLYQFFAAGPGVMGLGTATRYLAGTNDAIVPILAYYSLHVSLLSAVTGELVDSDIAEGNGSTWSFTDRIFSLRQTSELESALAGFDFRPDQRRATSTEFTIECVADEPAVDSPVVTLHGVVPGYMPYKETAVVPRGSSARLALTLRPVDNATFGSLRCVIDSTYPITSTGHLRGGQPQLTLFLNNGAKQYACPLYPDSDNTAILRGIPVDKYTVYAGTVGGQAIVPIEGNTIYTGPAETVLHFSLANVGGLGLNITDDAAHPWLGISVISFRLLGPQSQGTRFARFESAPYQLLGMPPGEYVLSLEYPAPASKSAPQVVQVYANQLSELTTIAAK